MDKKNRQSFLDEHKKKMNEMPKTEVKEIVKEEGLQKTYFSTPQATKGAETLRKKIIKKKTLGIVNDVDLDGNVTGQTLFISPFLKNKVFDGMGAEDFL